MIRSKSSLIASGPEVHLSFQRGIRQVVGAVRPTLGPTPRLVAVERPSRTEAPELVDDGGLIARRIVEVPDKYKNMGAMYARDVMLEVLESVGDGTATAAVLFQTIYDQALPFLMAGGDPHVLRQHLLTGAQVLLGLVDQLSVDIDGESDLAQLARTINGDEEISKLLGEIFDVVGIYGQVDIRAGHQRASERAYVEGMYWPSGVHSGLAIEDSAERRLEAEHCAILISDLDIQEPHEVVPLLELARDVGAGSILLTAMRISDSVLGLLASLPVSSTPRVIAVKTPGVRSSERAQDMEDLALMTGGRPLLQVAGQSMGGVRHEDLGFARRAWADRWHFGVVGGAGDPRRLRQHIRDLRASLEHADDAMEQSRLCERVGKLLGGSATLWVGGSTVTEITTRKQLADRTANALRSALKGGKVPGGGVVMLACRSGLQQLKDQSTDATEQFVMGILIRALEEPFRVILTNAGYDPSMALARIDAASPGKGFDVMSGRLIDDMAESGIVDSAAVVRMVLQKAIHSAALALTIDVLVPSKTRLPANAREET